MRIFAKYPWQAPLFAAVTVYGIYTYGWLDWRVLAMYLITALFIYLNFIMKKKKLNSKNIS